MVGLLGHLAGGAAQGLGKGIVAQAQAKRERQREDVRRQFQMQRDEEQREFRRGLLRDKQEFQREQGEMKYARENQRIGDTFTNDQGQVVGVRPDGSTKVLGNAQQDPRNPKLYEVYDENTGEPRKVAWDGEQFVPVGGTAAAGSGDGKSYEIDRKVQMLRGAGYSEREAVDIATGRKQADPSRVRQKARELAASEAEQGVIEMTPEAIDARANEIATSILEGPQASARKDADDANTDSDRSAAAASDGGGPGMGSMLWTPGLLNPMRGGGSGESKPKSDATTPKSQRSKPKGSGTNDDPYEVTAQDERAKQKQIDWFKQNAEPGDQIVIDGTTYTK